MHSSLISLHQPYSRPLVVLKSKRNCCVGPLVANYLLSYILYSTERIPLYLDVSSETAFLARFLFTSLLPLSLSRATCRVKCVAAAFYRTCLISALSVGQMVLRVSFVASIFASISLLLVSNLMNVAAMELVSVQIRTK